MRTKLFVISLLLTACLQRVAAQLPTLNLKWGKPTDEELKMSEYAADKDADALVLCHQTEVNYVFMNGGFKVFYRIKNRLKVLKPEGKRVADCRIAYYDNETDHLWKEAVNGLKATAYNLEDGKLVKTKMERSMTNEERIDKNKKVVKFSVPQVKVGTVIEYEYRIESDYFYDIHDWYAQRDIPVLYASYELSIPEWFDFNIEESGINQLEKKKSADPMRLVFGGAAESIIANVHSFIGRNLPALKDDDFVWHAEDYGNKVTAELRGIYIPGAVHKNYTTKWADIDRLLMEDEEFGGRLKKSSPLKAEIASAGIPSITDKQQRAAAVWKLLRSKVRWNGEYAFWGKSASKILKEGTGTNADINFLYINMLHDAGIDAVPIVMRSRDKGILPITHASLKYLNTFVVGIQVGDSAMMYFDSSAEDGYLNVLPAKLLAHRARIVSKTGQGMWVDLLRSARGRVVTTIEARLSADGILRGSRKSMLTEEEAAALRRRWRLAKDSLQLIGSLQERDGVRITSYQLEGRHDFSPNLNETMDFEKQCDAAGDIIYLNPLVFIPLRESPFSSAERILPVEFPYSQSETVNIVLSLPEGYVAEEMPQPMVIKGDGLSARVVGSVAGGLLRMQYRLNIDKTFYGQEHYQELKSFFDQLSEAVKGMVTIKKT